MFSVTTLIIIAVVLVIVLAALYLLMKSQPDEMREDAYIHGLEYWLEGNLPAAIRAMTTAAEEDRRSVDPYLQLGNLLRISGDPARAANIHRGLTVRPRLSRGQRVAISLSLVEDLLALSDWAEVGRLLDAMDKSARLSKRYWRSRFRQLDRIGDGSAAAKALRDAAKRLQGDESRLFSRHHELYQLNRAMNAAYDRKPGEARRLLKTVSGKAERQDLVHFISASASLAEEDFDRAAEKATEGILKHPEFSSLLLPVLQKALLESGHFDRAIPILESAVRESGAPISLVMTLALLYEKVGDRELALDLIAARSGNRDLNPNAAAAYLRILINDLPESDFSRVWSCLHLPEAVHADSCPSCGARHDHAQWYCGDCGAFVDDPASDRGEAPA